MLECTEGVKYMGVDAVLYVEHGYDERDDDGGTGSNGKG
jgi:hypothetical protein